MVEEAAVIVSIPTARMDVMVISDLSAGAALNVIVPVANVPVGFIKSHVLSWLTAT